MPVTLAAVGVPGVMILLAAAAAWLAVMAATCWLCTDAGMAFLAAIWGAK